MFTKSSLLSALGFLCATASGNAVTAIARMEGTKSYAPRPLAHSLGGVARQKRWAKKRRNYLKAKRLGRAA